MINNKMKGNVHKFRRLLKEDYNLTSVEMAKHFLGKILVRKLVDGTLLKGRIVEIESYLGGEDKGSSSYNGRRTAHNEPMYMDAGTTFVYMTYGMYYCFNISSKEPGASIFLRALEPLTGIYHMIDARNAKYKTKKQLKEFELCNGPSKLCIAMDINKANSNRINLIDNDDLWIEDDTEYEDFKIVAAPRIGIASAGIEWATKPLRFYILGNTSVSKRDATSEETASSF